MNDLLQKPQLNIPVVNGSYLFDKSILEKTTIDNPVYLLGVDTEDSFSLCYCLGRKVNEVYEVLLCDTMSDVKEFKKRVKNLSKYFNATIYGRITV